MLLTIFNSYYIFIVYCTLNGPSYDDGMLHCSILLLFESLGHIYDYSIVVLLFDSDRWYLDVTYKVSLYLRFHFQQANIIPCQSERTYTNWNIKIIDICREHYFLSIDIYFIAP